MPFLPAKSFLQINQKNMQTNDLGLHLPTFTKNKYSLKTVFHYVRFARAGEATFENLLERVERVQENKARFALAGIANVMENGFKMSENSVKVSGS